MGFCFFMLWKHPGSSVQNESHLGLSLVFLRRGGVKGALVSV